MLTKKFAAAMLERAIKTGCQTLAALLSAGAFGILDAPWLDSLSVAGMAAVLSLITSAGSDAVTTGDGPSLSNSELLRTHTEPDTDADDDVLPPTPPAVDSSDPATPDP